LDPDQHQNHADPQHWCRVYRTLTRTVPNYITIVLALGLCCTSVHCTYIQEVDFTKMEEFRKVFYNFVYKN
jgi:hypothetical protein